MEQILHIAFKISLIVFMAGNLGALGLQLELTEAIAPLRKVRFVVASLFASFIFGPALAYVLAVGIPMDRSYGVGLLVLGLTPVAPYLPLSMEKAGGDLASTASLMFLVSVVTVGFLPLAVPLVISGLTADAWSVAKPLIFLMLVPLAAGMVIHRRFDRITKWLCSPMKTITNIAAVLFIGLAVVMNFSSIVSAFGSGAFGAAILFGIGLLVGGYWIGYGLPREQKVVLSLGMSGRNIGAAAVVLGTEGDSRAITMLVIAGVVMVFLYLIAAPWFGRRSPGHAPPQASGRGATAALPQGN